MSKISNTSDPTAKDSQKTKKSIDPKSDSETTSEVELLRLGAALAASKIGVFEFEPQTNKAFWDNRVGMLWGIPETEDITYETVIGQVHPDDVKLHDDGTERALDPDGSGELNMEYRVLPRDGSPMRWIKAIAICTFDGNSPVKLLGTVQDVTDRRAYEERNLLLVNELQHRVKNTIASILSVIKLSRSSKKSIDDYALGLEDRLLSMAETHNILSRNEWQTVRFKDILQIEFDAFLGGQSKAISVSGDDLVIPARQVKIIAMGIHELLTNATKHGALRSPDGRIKIQTFLNGNNVRFIWREKTPLTPKDSENANIGFGTLLLTQILKAELRGTTSHQILPEGALFELEFPLQQENGDE